MPPTDTLPLNDAVVPLIEPKEVAVMIPAVTLPTVMSSSELLRVTLPVLPYSPVTALDVAPAKPI